MEVVYFVTKEQKSDFGLQAFLIKEPSEQSEDTAEEADRMRGIPGSRHLGESQVWMKWRWWTVVWEGPAWSVHQEPEQRRFWDESEKLGSVCGLGPSSCGVQGARRVRPPQSHIRPVSTPLAAISSRSRSWLQWLLLSSLPLQDPQSLNTWKKTLNLIIRIYIQVHILAKAHLL